MSAQLGQHKQCIPRKPIPERDKPFPSVGYSSVLDQDHPLQNIPLSTPTFDKKRCDVEDQDSESSARQNAVKSKLSTIGCVLRIWMTEMICCVIGVTGLCVLVALFSAYNGQPLPNWPHSITLNTVIAILVILIKASILLITAQGISHLKWSWMSTDTARPINDMERFDLASRGPWGSVYFLWNLKGRAVLASLGCLITVTSLALDPFAQQIVHYQDCTIQSLAGEAVLPVTHWYTDVLYYSDEMVTVSSTVQELMTSAITGRLAETITAQCSSANCTFSDYKSLGWCSRCKDISDTMKNQTMDGFQRLSLDSGIFCTVGSASLAMIGVSSSNSIFQLLYCDNYKSTYTPDTDSSWLSNGAGAASCSIYPCVRTYSAEVVNGVLTEDVLTTTPSSDVAYADLVLQNAYLDLYCLTAGEYKTIVTDQELKVTPGQTWLDYNGSHSVAGPGNGQSGVWIGDLLEPPGRCFYEVTENALYGLATYSATLFNATLASASMGIGDSNLIVPQAFYDAINTRTEYGMSNPTVEIVEGIMRDITDSLTVYARQQPAETSGIPGYVNRTLGHVILDDTCVHVRWVWLIFPAAIVLLSAMFLTAVMVESGVRSSQEISDWKSETLPLIFLGIAENHAAAEPRNALQPTQLNGLKDMRLKAEVTEVTLARRHGGWYLSASR